MGKEAEHNPTPAIFPELSITHILEQIALVEERAENIIKALPGVSSSSQMSSGGGFPAQRGAKYIQCTSRVIREEGATRSRTRVWRGEEYPLLQRPICPQPGTQMVVSHSTERLLPPRGQLQPGGLSPNPVESPP